jgi:hypothetical protein
MRPIPLRPDPGALVTRNVNALVRATIAKAMARLDPRCDEREHLRVRWPNAPVFLRAASPHHEPGKFGRWASVTRPKALDEC